MPLPVVTPTPAPTRTCGGTDKNPTAHPDNATINSPAIYAFKNCASLVSINLENVDDIREGAFYGCTALENITLGESVNVEDWAFSRVPGCNP